MEITTLEPLPIISFSYNWNNKLNCKAFTTIRLTNPQKYVEGREYWIQLKKLPISKSVIRAQTSFMLASMNDFIAYLDTGYTATQAKGIILKMYPKVDFERQSLSLILLEQIERVESRYDPAGLECKEYFYVTPWKSQ